MKPFVKWAGGKRQILKYIRKFIDNSHDENNNNFNYIEPFLGGGAVFFDLQPKKAIINDLNSDLINAYQVIKSDEYQELINELKNFSKQYLNDKDDFYYTLRQIDRDDNWPNGYTRVYRAARMIFLNRTCYNGLYRVNGKGQFNTPIGRYSNPLICDEDNIKQIHTFLNENKITIMNESYEKAIAKAKENDIIYLDPPYDYEDDDGFTKYQMNGFTFEDFKTLKKHCDKALEKGAYVIISNNATTRVMELFDDAQYKIFYDNYKLDTKRTINSNPDGRSNGKEIIFWGIPCQFPQANSIEKIIKLIKAGEDSLLNKEKCKEILEVTSDRQVSYYYSSLVYLGFVTSNRKYKEEIKEKITNQNNIEKLLFEKIMEKDLFNELYTLFELKTIDDTIIKKKLKKAHAKLDDDTINRRASTVKAWLKWMYLYKEKDNKKEN